MIELRRPMLVIEDDDLDAEMTIEALHACGVKCPIVRLNDGAAAVDYLARASKDEFDDVLLPSLMLLDIRMPRLDGIDVLRFRRGVEALRDVPVVMFTSSVHDSDVNRCIELGASAYVVKPVDPKSYSAAVEATGRFWYRFNRVAQQRPQPS